MIKNIKIDKSQSVEINSSMGWLYVYQEQFGHDPMVVIMPAIEAGLGTIVSILNKTKASDEGELHLHNIIDALDDEILQSAFIQLSGMQLTTITNCIWAMAKNADDDIPEPMEWFNGFESFPVDVILPEVIRTIINSSISKKNIKKLMEIRTAIKKASPSASKDSQSQESTEA